MVTAYVTAPRDDAHRLAETLVEERLAACVNVVDCRSVYRWDDEVTHDDEAILLAKTTADRYADLQSCVVGLHPYEVPCVERIEESELLDSFAEWRAESVR